MRKTNSGAGLVFLVPVVLIIAFVLFTRGTEALSSMSIYIVAGIAVIAVTLYNAYVVRLLYAYYESKAPWYSYIPCFGELTLMDSKYLKIGSVLYALVILLGLSSLLPVYKVNAALVELPFYLIIAAIGVLLALQLVKGLGLLNCMANVEDAWKENAQRGLGSIKALVWTGFLPFGRALAMYAIAKPLSTMVEFMDVSVEDTSDEEYLEEE